MSRTEVYSNWRIGAELAAAPGIRRKAKAGYTTARAIAPVDTGRYRRELALVRSAGPGGGWRIEANAPYSIYVEYGTRKMQAYHTLAVALDAAKG